jgi:effector-binding domain-containing protein
MTPFHEIKKVPAMKVAVWRGDVSMWGIDTAFSRLYDRAMEQKLLFRQPALGIRHGGVRIPEPFHADYEIMFPLTADPGRAVPGIDVKDLPGQEVASFVHRGPYQWIPCTYEKVLDWLEENRYEEAGETREVFFVAPEPHSGGTQDDMLTEIQVPIRLRSEGEKLVGASADKSAGRRDERAKPGLSFGGRVRRVA